ncbi:MAG: thioredoxin domain-containing protein [Gemmatimonadota bacterium]|nr:thioredoxin domain-containing protein [Gemmatimonadota bacterium]
MNGRTIVYLLGLVAVALFSWGLARTTGAPVAGRADSRDGADILARVEGREITRAEIEEAAGAQFMQLRKQMYDLTEQSLQRTIDGALLDAAAEKQGLDRDAFLALLVDSNPPAPSEAQIDSVYEQFKSQINQPRENVAPQIEAFLVNQARQTRYDSLLKALRAEYEVTNYLEPPRLEVAATGPATGPDDAPVTIVEFSDFECPFCLRIHPTLQRVMSEYEGDVRLVFRQFPLTNIHPRAQKAAEASLCAHEQGRFWDMHDALFADPSNLGVPALKERAGTLGLDVAAFDQCLDSSEKAAVVAADLQAGRRLGVSGTPALYINGRQLQGAQPYDVIARVIDDELRRAGT